MAILRTTQLPEGRVVAAVDHDPTAVNTDVLAGSIIIDASGNLYVKQDDGPSMNAFLFANVSGALAAHATQHENGGSDEMSVAGLSGTLADPQTPSAHGTAHEDGGGDEISVAGLSGLLADPQTPTAHVSAHNPGGGDAIATAAAGTIAVGDSAAEGAAASVARSDHTHALPAPPAPANVTKAAASAGAATTVARSDHKHDVTTAAAGAIAIGDAAAEGSATSLSRSDHTHSLAAPSSPADVSKSTAAVGSSTAPARADHKHNIQTDTAVGVGPASANAEGVATSLARSDHAHKVTVPNNVASSAATTTTASGTPGVMTSMTVTPGAGTYLAIFAANIDHSATNETITTGIYVNAVLQTNSSRLWRRGAGQGDIRTTQVNIAVVTPAGGQAVDVRWSTSAATASAYNRHLILIRLS